MHISYVYGDHSIRIITQMHGSRVRVTALLECFKRQDVILKALILGCGYIDCFKIMDTTPYFYFVFDLFIHPCKKFKSVLLL